MSEVAATPVSPPAPASPAAGEGRRVARGMVALLVSQLLSTPLSILASAVLARRLGPADYGVLYLAQTAVALGFLFVDWGQSVAVAGEVARDHGRAERLLGTSMALKLGLAAVATAVLVAQGVIQGYTAAALAALLFYCAANTIGQLRASGASVLRGLERIKQVSALGLFGNVCSALFEISFALAGGGLLGVLWAAVLASVVGSVPLLFLLRRCRVRVPRLGREELRVLVGRGSGFLLLNVVLTLQPYIDATFLSHLAPGEVMGWHAATRRIAGALLMPAASLGFAVFPTLSRLHQEAPDRERDLVRGILRAMVLAGVPVGLGAVLFAPTIVHLIYGHGRFEGVVLNLQVLSPYLLLVYLSILVGNALMARGQVLRWSAVQLICVAVSLVGNYPLVRFCQGRLGNGAVGISVAGGLSELIMIALGLALLPGALRRGLGRAAWQAAAAGAAMVGAVLGLAHLGVPVAAQLLAAPPAYAGVLWAVGGLRRGDLAEVVAIFRARAASRAA